MREAALRKRRQQAEQLLQWNQKLLEEEKRINELEFKASSIISQQHNTTIISDDKHKFSGKQLNKLWYNLTGCEENKFKDDKIYRMSQIALERFCKSAREYSVKTKKLLSKSSNSDYSVADISVSDNVTKTKIVQSSSVPSDFEKQTDNLQDASLSKISLKDYTPDFEVDTSENVVDVADIDLNENIDELIQNFSRIEDDISSLGSKHCDGTVNEERKSESPKSNKSDSDAEISVIETNRLVNKSSHPITEIPENLEKSHDNSVKRITGDDSVGNNDHHQLISSVISIEGAGISSTKSKIITNESFPVETQDNLNESKEILLILGESESNINAFEEPNIGRTTAENVNTSEEILLTLNEIADVATDNKFVENSALFVKSVPNKDTSLVQSIRTEKEDLNTSDNILSLIPDQAIGNLILEEQCTLVDSFNEFSQIGLSACQLNTESLKIIPEEFPNKISNSCTNVEIEENSFSVDEQKLLSQNDRSKDTDIEEELPSEFESVKKSDQSLTSLIQNEERNPLFHSDPLEIIITEKVAPVSTFIQNIHSEKQVETGKELDYHNNIYSNNLKRCSFLYFPYFFIKVYNNNCFLNESSQIYCLI